jgi:hypothetical protein
MPLMFFCTTAARAIKLRNLGHRSLKAKDPIENIDIRRQIG